MPTSRRGPGSRLPILKLDNGRASGAAPGRPHSASRTGNTPARKAAGFRPYSPTGAELPGSTGARNRSRWQPMLVIARPMTSSGPAGAVVDATRSHRRLGPQQVLQAARDCRFFFYRRQHEAGRRAEMLQPLAHDALEQLPRAIAMHRIGIQNRDRRRTHRPRLENGPALLQNVDHRLQMRLRHRKRRAL